MKDKQTKQNKQLEQIKGSHTSLPTFYEVTEKKLNRIPLSALEAYVLKNEPNFEDEAAVWRDELSLQLFNKVANNL